MANYTEEEKKELESLRRQAELLGVAYSGNTSLATLRENVRKVAGTPEENAAKDDAYSKLYNEKMRLIRCEVQCLHPMYRNAGGTFISLSNSVLGSYKWFVYFNRPVHITKWCYDFLKDSVWVERVEKGTVDKFGRTHNETINVTRRTYAITDLPPLTKEELEKLATDQQISGRLEDKE